MDDTRPTPEDWDWKKFNLNPEILLTTLHDRFNTLTMPLQDPEAFSNDVQDCLKQAKTEDEFYSKLEERKAQRMDETTKAWDEIKALVKSRPWILGCEHCYDLENAEDRNKNPDTENDSVSARWVAFCRLGRTMSLDSLVSYFEGFTRDQRKREDEKRRWAKEIFDKILERQRRRFASIESEPPSPTRPTTPEEASETEQAESYQLKIKQLKQLKNYVSLIRLGIVPSTQAPVKLSRGEDAFPTTEEAQVEDSASMTPEKKPQGAQQQVSSEHET